MIKRPAYLLIILFWICSGTLSMAQLHTTSRKALKIYNQALQSYRFVDYEKAVTELKMVLAEDPGFLEAQLLMAEICTDMKNYEPAIEAYQAVIDIDPGFYPGALYNLGRLEVLTGNYSDATGHLNAYLSYGDIKENLRIKSERNLKTCAFALRAMADPVPFNPVNLGKEINSTYDEYWPSITADNKTLVITRLEPDQGPVNVMRGRRKIENFYVSRNINNVWTMAENMGAPINTGGNEGAQSLSADGYFMYFTACDRSTGLGSCDLYISSSLYGKWSAPSNMGAPVNSKSWEAQPSISSDGTTLYFVSNRPGGYGKMDLWKTSLTGGEWTKPENLGPGVNTPDNEMSPHISKDNKTLYFSSDGWVGMGGFDLFITRKDSDTAWTPPENLGYPINTWSDEIGMIVSADGTMAYYSSAFSDSTRKDIYSFELYTRVRPDPVSYIKGRVFDAETKKPLIARFELLDLLSDQPTIQSFSNSDGEFLVSLPVNNDYALNVSHPDYLFYSEHFSLKGVTTVSDPFIMEVALNKVKEGERSVLRNIFFEYNSYSLLEESLVELRKLLSFLNSNPEVSIEIQGYTDSEGTPEYNLDLSEKRARAVYNFLTDNGISETRLNYRGFGETQPVETNKTEYGRSRNRRIEILVKRIDSLQ